jgi:hypothetical protein
MSAADAKKYGIRRNYCKEEVIDVRNLSRDKLKDNSGYTFKVF